MVIWNKDHTDSLVLGTVNAPYRNGATADELAHRLAASDSDFPQVYELFMNVEPELILEFATRHGVKPRALIDAFGKIRSEGWVPQEKVIAAILELDRTGRYPD